MIQNRVVVRFEDGRVLKGFTSDFLPTKDRFHLQPADAPPGTRPTEVTFAGLKAVFFVKDWASNPPHEDRKEFDPAKPAIGRKLRVVFKDGELLVGTTQGYQPGRPAFFVVPADAGSNIERCFVITAATREVSFL